MTEKPKTRSVPLETIELNLKVPKLLEIIPDSVSALAVHWSLFHPSTEMKMSFVISGVNRGIQSLRTGVEAQYRVRGHGLTTLAQSITKKNS